MAEPRPPSIRYFEQLTVASFAIGLLHQFAVTTNGLIVTLVTAAITIGLALLVSRRRKNWARWILTILFGLGAVLMAVDIRATFAIGYPFVTVVVLLLQAIALALLFTRSSSEWLRRKEPLADVFS